MASKDPVALDIVQEKIMGLNREICPTLIAAKERLPDSCNMDNIEILGEPLDEILISNLALPNNISRTIRKNFIGKIFDTIINSFYQMRGMGLVSQKIIDIYIDPFAKSCFTRYPEVNIEKCSLCKTCIKICPIENITIKDKKIKINIDKCIRCYCCSEMCPRGAMNLKYSRLGSFLRAI